MLNADILLEEYIVNNKTAKQIADKYGYGVNQIYY